MSKGRETEPTSRPSKRKRHQNRSGGISRRDFLRIAAGGAIGVGLAAAGYKLIEGQQGGQAEQIFLSENVNPDELMTVYNRAIGDYNAVFDTDLSAQDFGNRITFIETISEFQAVMKKVESDYQNQDESQRPAITDDNGHIYVNVESIRNLTQDIQSDEVGRKMRAEFVEEILLHELVHQLAFPDKSSALYEVVYNNMFVNILDPQTLMRHQVDVRGAEVYAYSNQDGRVKSVFQDLEEAEAIAISRYVINNRPRGRLIDPISSYVPNQSSLFDVFLHTLGQRTNQDVGNLITELASTRRQQGGRESWCRTIGSAFGIKSEEQLYFSLSAFYAIEIGNQDILGSLIANAN